MPFAVLLAVGLAYARQPDVRVYVELDRERVLEDDEITLEVELDARDSVARLELLVEVHARARADQRQESGRRFGSRSARNECSTSASAAPAGRLPARRRPCSRARDAAGLLPREQTLDRAETLRVYPRPEQLRELVAPRETQLFTGNRVLSRQKGEGLEFARSAAVRARRPDQADQLARQRAPRRPLGPAEFHAERNADVIIFLDSFADARRGGTERSTRRFGRPPR